MSDARIIAHRMRISQVLTNLFTNMVKYSPDSVNVNVDLTVNENKQTVRTTVTNQGIGIPAANQDSLFQRFYGPIM